MKQLKLYVPLLITIPYDYCQKHHAIGLLVIYSLPFARVSYKYMTSIISYIKNLPDIKDPFTYISSGLVVNHCICMYAYVQHETQYPSNVHEQLHHV